MSPFCLHANGSNFLKSLLGCGHCWMSDELSIVSRDGYFFKNYKN
jgi:hypothetical protein